MVPALTAQNSECFLLCFDYFNYYRAACVYHLWSSSASHNTQNLFSHIEEFSQQHTKLQKHRTTPHKKQPWFYCFTTSQQQIQMNNYQQDTSTFSKGAL